MLGLLVEPKRLRVVSALVLGASTVSDIVEATGLGIEDARRAIARLTAAGVVANDGNGYRVAIEDLQAAARASAERPVPYDEPGVPAEKAKVLRAFIVGRRLKSIPAVRAKRLVVLDHLAQGFEPGRRYEERDVNEILAHYHPDFAALRRYLVDEGFLERERGQYWRIGGTFEVN